METKTKYIIIGGAALAVVAFILLRKKSAATQSGEMTADEAVSRSARNAANAAVEAISGTQMSEEDAAYNQAREKYRQVAGKYPPASWTKEMIESWIAEQEKKNDAIKRYVALTEGSSYAKNELSGSGDETLAQIEALITKANNQIAAGKKQERTAHITSLVGRFQATLQAPNYMLMSATQKNAWDVSTLNEMLKLSADEKREFNAIFKAKGGSGKIPDYFNQGKSKWRNRETVYDAIVKGNANTGRTGASTANVVKSAFANA